jgi:putative aminopeptidase FrvX
VANDLRFSNRVYFHVRSEVHNRFTHSRYLGDKAFLTCLFAGAKAVRGNKFVVARRTTLHIRSYEEVCQNGAIGVPKDVSGFLALPGQNNNIELMLGVFPRFSSDAQAL